MQDAGFLSLRGMPVELWIVDSTVLDADGGASANALKKMSIGNVVD